MTALDVAAAGGRGDGDGVCAELHKHTPAPRQSRISKVLVLYMTLYIYCSWIEMEIIVLYVEYAYIIVFLQVLGLVVKRSGQRIKQLFIQLDTRLKSVDEKSRMMGVRGQGKEGLQKKKIRDRPIIHETPDDTVPTT